MGLHKTSFILLLTCFLIFCLCSVLGENSATSNNAAKNEGLAAFLSKRDHSKLNKVEFKDLPKQKSGYVGKVVMYATKDIKEGELLYSYPLTEAHATISVEEAKRDPNVGHLFTLFSQEDQKEEEKKVTDHAEEEEEVKDLTEETTTSSESKEKIYLYPDEIIRLYALYLKFNDVPEWKPYFDSLPEQLYDAPYFWTPEELAEIKGSPLHAFVMETNKSVANDYQVLFPKISKNYPTEFPLEKFTLREFLWSFSLFRGRHWANSETIYNPITPIYDLFNFKQESAVKIVENKGVLEFIASEDIEKGEEIVINNGTLSNRDLLDFYGLALSKNPSESYEVGIAIEKSDQFYGNKKRLLERKGLKNHQTYYLTEKGIPDDLVFALRIYHANVYDFDKTEAAFFKRSVSYNNELACCRSMMKLCQDAMKSYPTTLKEDRSLLEEGKMSRRKTLAVNLRRGEKKVLFKNYQQAKEAEKMILTNWNLRDMEVPGQGLKTRDARTGEEIL